jgi:hypothetical protein
MWYLEVIGDTPEPFTDEIPLRDIDAESFKRILKKANSEFSEDYLGPYSYQVVNLQALSDLRPYLESQPAVNDAFQYHITYYEE